MNNSAMFQTLINTVDTTVGSDSSRDRTIGLFHLLAAALDWCDTYKVDFDLTLQEVREHIGDTEKPI